MSRSDRGVFYHQNEVLLTSGLLRWMATLAMTRPLIGCFATLAMTQPFIGVPEMNETS
ncbi:MAG TPA: hypothetical protein VIK07_07665 [Bacteroidales bacterium]